jgi:hypothetical protein
MPIYRPFGAAISCDSCAFIGWDSDMLHDSSAMKELAMIGNHKAQKFRWYSPKSPMSSAFGDK